MTTEEALAIAESVQFGDRPPIRKKPERKHPLVDARVHLTRKERDTGKSKGFALRRDGKGSYRGKMPHYAHHEGGGVVPTNVESAERLNYKNKNKNRDHVTIQHVENVHLSESQQFAEDIKSRYDAAERQAMRRAIAKASIHPAIKVALFRHADAVQFSDSGDEIPSVPMRWVLAAAKGILQMAIVPQTMDALNEGMEEDALDALYSGDSKALDAIAGLINQHGLHDEFVRRLRMARAPIVDRSPMDDREKVRVVNQRRYG